MPSPEAIERHPHLAEPRADGVLRVDLHSHTMWSGDSTTTPDELAAALTAAALDVVCITDHHTISGAVELHDSLPCRVVVGEEVRTPMGELIGLFLAERVPAGLSPLRAAQAIREQGGLVYVPHPFDPQRPNLTEPVLRELAAAGLVDAVEVVNAKTSTAGRNAKAAAFAAEFDLPGGAGSDAHVPDALGAAYVEMADFDGPDGFLHSLRAGRAVGHHWDRPRPWSPRIVPSAGT